MQYLLKHQQCVVFGIKRMVDAMQYTQLLSVVHCFFVKITVGCFVLGGLVVCLSFCLLGLYPWHMEVPRLGVELEL